MQSMTSNFHGNVVAVLAALLLIGCAEEAQEATKSEPQQSILVAGTPMHGIQGLAWGPDGYLYAGAISAQEISKIDPETGDVELIVGAPLGQADDLALAEDGTLVWTAIGAGELRLRKPDGTVVTIATDLRGINPVAFRKDGRLVAGQMIIREALFEFDPAGKIEPRVITDAVREVNGFEFGSDGRLYAPYWQEGTLVAIDIDSGDIEELAHGLGTPSALSLDSQGRMVTVDYNTGKIKRTDPKTGKTELIASVAPPVDNVAVGPDDTIYISDTANSGILAIDPSTGKHRKVVGGSFSTPGDLTVTTESGNEALIVADSTGYRFVDPMSGVVTRPPFKFGVGGSLSIDATDSLLAFADVRSGRVHMVDRISGDVLWNTMGAADPYGILIQDGATAIVAEYSKGALQQYNGSTTATLIVDGLDGPVGITRAGAHSVYVTENNSGHITLIDLAKGTKVRVASGLDRPEGLAIMTDGRLAVVEAGAASLSAIDLDSGEKTVLVSDLPLDVAVSAPAAIGMLTGVVVASDGAIYVSCAGDNSIRKIIIDDN